jgi:hypothetical protein
VRTDVERTKAIASGDNRLVIRRAAGTTGRPAAGGWRLGVDNWKLEVHA